MSVSRTKYLLTSLVFAGPLLAWLAFPALGQNAADTPTAPPNRDASFLTPEQATASPPISLPAFSGLATEPPTAVAPPPA
ncbi:MAG: hypothetical protein WCD70_14685, partial [Alphaproteobacteria bacterium]